MSPKINTEGPSAARTFSFIIHSQYAGRFNRQRRRLEAVQRPRSVLKRDPLILIVKSVSSCSLITDFFAPERTEEFSKLVCLVLRGKEFLLVRVLFQQHEPR